MQYEALNQWHFVIAAYVIGLGGCGALVVQSWLAMRRAERRRDDARKRPDPLAEQDGPSA